MILETKRLFLREMNMDDYDALYAVLADKDIMQHYLYDFDENRVREHLRLGEADYYKVSLYGHFGKPETPWEN